VLDFGCGSKPYLNIFKYNKYIGLDYATEVSERNTKLAADAFYDGKTIPFGNATFDSVFSSEVLEHVFNPDEILPEIYRVLKPGGCMLLTCPFFWPEHEQPYDFARYSSFALKNLMTKHGFEIVAYEKTGSYLEAQFQGLALFLYYFIPHRPKILEIPFFILFITPVILAGIALARILPKRIKRKDLYLNNVIVVKKK
jgi:SAM-dependent methyltransferase